MDVKVVGVDVEDLEVEVVGVEDLEASPLARGDIEDCNVEETILGSVI